MSASVSAIQKGQKRKMIRVCSDIKAHMNEQSEGCEEQELEHGTRQLELLDKRIVLQPELTCEAAA